MANGDGGYGYGSGFGSRIPSQELKVNEKEETPLLLKQFKWAIVIILGFVWAVYASINVLFGKNDLHYIILGIYAVLCIGTFIWLRRFFEKRYDNYYIFREQNEDGEWRSHLTMNTLRAFLIALALFIGLSTQTLDYTVSVIHFPDESSDFGVIITSVGRFTVLSITGSIVLPTISMILRLVWREIPDNLHGDTQTEQNRQKVQLDREKLYWEMEKWHLEHPNAGQMVIDQPEEAARPILIKAPDKSLPAPTDSDERYKDMVMEFLEGIEDGKWTTAERTWRGDKRLIRTGYRVKAVGDRICNDLMSAGWAIWKNPDDHSSGKELLFSVEEIKNGAFNDENRRLGLNGKRNSESPIIDNDSDEEGES